MYSSLLQEVLPLMHLLLMTLMFGDASSSADVISSLHYSIKHCSLPLQQKDTNCKASAKNVLIGGA